jgi:hypothetical protein
MEAIRSSETSGTTQRTTRRHIPEEDTLHLNLLFDNTDTIKKNTETPIGAGKKVGLQVNAEKTKYVLLSRHQNAGQNHNTNIGNRSSENVAEFKYFGKTIMDQKCYSQGK